MSQSLQHHKLDIDQKNPLVSVIIDNYNYGCFLPKAIESVLQQTYKNFELIVVDDGSTDNSREVIESFQGQLTAIFQANSGQGMAFNTGIAKAQGEIICLLDADDYFREDKLAKVVAAFQEHPQWVQVSHGRISVDREGVAIGQGYSTHNYGDVTPLLLEFGRYAMGITSSLAYRRSVLEHILPIPTKRTEAADTFLTVVIPFYGEVGCIDEPLMFYRLHGNNRRGHNDNWPRLIQQRELTATYINETAAKVGLSDRFTLRRDADYRSLKAIEQGKSLGAETLQVIWLSLRESAAIGLSTKDTLERVLRRSFCTLFPTQGKSVLRLGLRGYFRQYLTRVG
ncbi:glycosyltransferase [Pleurocapsa sp. PCC 7319]|uniref:glycosyltransferase family 2 protein n=1 Tax=Pleurocapsa sp. PCC 7319 TaxID=118161 RepID=UPI000348D02D|nr:glycosyltransferase [Pleurocapsa sp. PCC 7319]